MLRRKLVPLTAFCLLLGLNPGQTGGQRQTAAISWERAFPHSVHWYVRTSLGVLLVRAGKSLTALDGRDGRQLWSLADIAIGGGHAESNDRGNNLLEIPGFPTLLINRAKLSGAEEGKLLAFNIWTGEKKWEQPELDDFLGVIQLRNNGHILLLTKKLNKGLKTALVAAEASGAFSGIGIFTGYPWSVPFPFRLVLTSLDPSNGNIDWTEEYPRVFSPSFLEFRQFNGRLYVHESSDNGCLLGTVDTQNGQRIWDFKAGNSLLGSDCPPLQFVGGHVILAEKNLFAFSPGSSKPSWTIQHVGKIAGLVSDKDLLIITVRHNVLGIDATTGAIRWKIPLNGNPTNPVLLADEHAIALCDKGDFVVIEISSGTVLRRVRTNLQEGPIALREVGKTFVMADRGSASSIFSISSGERYSDEPKVDGVFPAISGLLAQPLPPFGGLDVPDEIREGIEDAWANQANSAQEPAFQELLAQTRSTFRDGSRGPRIFVTETDRSDKWRFWRVDTETGYRQQVEIYGTKPDANPVLGLLYVVQHDKLQAIKLPQFATPSPNSTNSTF